MRWVRQRTAFIDQEASLGLFQQHPDLQRQRGLLAQADQRHAIVMAIFETELIQFLGKFAFAILPPDDAVARMVMATAGKQAFQMGMDVGQVHAYSSSPIFFGQTLSLKASRLPNLA